MRLSDLPTPALLLDAEVLEQNLSRMQERADQFGVVLRPHIKTHKCVPIAERQRVLGARGITVSTFYEAERFAQAGFTDITWAFPFPPVYAHAAADLAKKVTLRLVVDSTEATEALERQASASGIRFHVWLKVDSGLHRAGVDPAKPESLRLARALAQSRQLEFDGLLTHAGHSYNAPTTDRIREIARQEQSVLVEFAERLRHDGIAVSGLSIGSTPTMTLADSIAGVTEIRPGNYVFHDLTMVSLGVCGVNNCALTVLASVISTRPGTVIIDAGALALSKDLGATHRSPDSHLGLVFSDYASHALFAPSAAHVASVSQEHGKLLVGEGVSFRVGDRVRILEQHSCLTAALFDRYHVVRGDEVVDRWEILRGRM
jgi:D-serine deaminase-like pyridoxal phosphate-dependent protein